MDIFRQFSQQLLDLGSLWNFEYTFKRTCNGFVLQMAHVYSKKSIVKKSLKNITKWYLRVSSLMSTIYFLH